MAPAYLNLGAGCLVPFLDTFQDPTEMSPNFFQIHKPEPTPLSAAYIWRIFLCLETSAIDSFSIFIVHITLYHQGFIFTPRE